MPRDYDTTHFSLGFTGLPSVPPPTAPLPLEEKEVLKIVLMSPERSMLITEPRLPFSVAVSPLALRGGDRTLALLAAKRGSLST
jgi:hypothetical protein